MSTARRQRAWRRGQAAEALCVAWLMLRGYRIIGRRLRTPVGEIDIAARRRQTLAIVEVKARADQRRALETISAGQRRRLVRGDAVADCRPAGSGGAAYPLRRHGGGAMADTEICD